MAAKGKFDINKLAAKAKQAAARRRTQKVESGDRVKVGGERKGAGSTGATGVAGPGGSIASRLAAREAKGIDLGFEDRGRNDFPGEGDTSGGEFLELSRSEHVVRYKLGGRRIESGDVFEVYTNKQTGWLQGRFEWTGRGKDRPYIALNLWNPNGPFDDGQPPWCGDLMCKLPENAVCRWVDEG